MGAQAARTAAALRALVGALRETAAELDLLAARAQALLGQVEAGRPLGEVMGEEPRPLMITRLTMVTDRLHEVGGEARRAEAHQLRSEGYTQEGIAQVFGVSRQRAAALLQPRSGARPKRPKAP